MKWLVQLVCTRDGYEGSLIASQYSGGVVVDERREGAHAILSAAFKQWPGEPLDGEEYTLTPLSVPQRVRVVARDDGFSVERI